jgi:hypothetical protein
MKNKFSFYLDVIAKSLFIIALIFMGYRIENLIEYNKNAIEYNKNAIEYNTEFNKKQLEKLDESIQGKL